MITAVEIVVKRVIWTWCPRCMDREEQEVLEGGELRCRKCGTVWRRDGEI